MLQNRAKVCSVFLSILDLEHKPFQTGEIVFKSVVAQIEAPSPAQAWAGPTLALLEMANSSAFFPEHRAEPSRAEPEGPVHYAVPFAEGRDIGRRQTTDGAPTLSTVNAWC